MKKFICDRCRTKIGQSASKDEGAYYDVRRSSDLSRFGHKNEKYICEPCLKTDERYKKEREETFSKKASG